MLTQVPHQKQSRSLTLVILAKPMLRLMSNDNTSSSFSRTTPHRGEGDSAGKGREDILKGN